MITCLIKKLTTINDGLYSNINNNVTSYRQMKGKIWTSRRKEKRRTHTHTRSPSTPQSLD